MKQLLILYLLANSINFCVAQSIEFSGQIENDTEWNYDTVKITGDVNVISGTTLRIGAGSTIQFQGNYKLSSLGRIIAIGEKDKKIVFSINDTTGFSSERSNIGWAGMKLNYPWDGGNYGNDNPNDSSFFNYCTIEYSRNGALIIENFSKVKIINCYFRNNYGSNGAGININRSNPRIDSCRFINNYSNSYGGAIYNSDDTQYPYPSNYPRITNSVFIQNHGSHGGAINYSGYMYLVGNIISHNSSYNGGAIKFFGVNGIMANNIICNNTAVYGGGAIYGGGNNTDLLIANNTICNNKSEYAPGIYLSYENYEFINNIVWNNKATREDSLQLYLSSPDPTINVLNCLLEDYLSYNLSDFNTDENNIYGNPSFLNPTDSLIYNSDDIFKNWSLDSNSICIDKGTNVYNNYANFSLKYDISGKKRKSNCTIDIGALEFQFYNSHPVISDADFSIDENIITSSFVGKVIATDPDNDELHFEIVSGNNLGAFQIDLLTGEITVADSTPLDYETNPVFELYIQVSDCEFSVIGIVTVTLNDVDDMVLGILDQQKNIVKLYPNPTKDKIRINYDSPETLRIELYDISGKQICYENLYNNKEIDLSKINSGLYYLIIKDCTTVIAVKKIIKE